MSALTPMAPGGAGIGPAANLPSEELREAAEAFEALFLNMLLKSMRRTIPEGGMFNSQQMQGYQEMQDRELANDLARRGSVGIAELMVRQLGGERGEPRPQPLSARSFGYPAATAVQGGAAAHRHQPSTGSPAEVKTGFIRKLLPIAAKYAAKLSLPTPVLIAQAALETGWGKHIPAEDSGRSSHNLFGIKANSSWAGSRSRAQTQEYRGAGPITESAEFRAYRSFEHSFADYVALIRGSGRYAEARASGDPAAYLESLQEAGYATDPNYADKVLAILGDTDFQQTLEQHESALGRQAGGAAPLNGNDHG